MPAVGNSVPRKDGIGKATGHALYADDLTFPNMLHGRTIRSTIPCGRVRSVRVVGNTPGLIVVDHRDIPGRNVVDLIEQDQPFLVERDVRHLAEPILLLAHEDRDVLNAVRVDIDYEELEPQFDPERSNGVLKALDIVKGDVDAALADADFIVEGTYRTGHQEHVYIEPNVVVAMPEDGASRCSARCSVRFTCSRRSRVFSARARISGSCRAKRAAGSAAKRSIRR
jgi:CO/xanthine dehydrogenase Mo-binding subunit